MAAHVQQQLLLRAAAVQHAVTSNVDQLFIKTAKLQTSRLSLGESGDRMQPHRGAVPESGDPMSLAVYRVRSRPCAKTRSWRKELPYESLGPNDVRIFQLDLL